MTRTAASLANGVLLRLQRFGAVYSCLHLRRSGKTSLTAKVLDDEPFIYLPVGRNNGASPCADYCKETASALGEKSIGGQPKKLEETCGIIRFD